MVYRMTPARRAALRKAQLASARKRRLRTGNGVDYGPMKNWAADDRALYRQPRKKPKKKKSGPSRRTRAKWRVQGHGAAKVARLGGLADRKKKVVGNRIRSLNETRKQMKATRKSYTPAQKRKYRRAAFKAVGKAGAGAAAHGVARHYMTPGQRLTHSAVGLGLAVRKQRKTKKRRKR